MTGAIVVLTTTESVEQAEKLAVLLIERQLAACVQIVPRIKSVYRWQGKVESSGESLILIKTTEDAYKILEETITEAHREWGGYEKPEIIAVSIDHGVTSYLNWLFGSVKEDLRR